MEAYCKAGPTQLVLADLHQVPDQMTRAGFHGEWKAQCYALATTYAGRNWTPVAETEGLWHQRGELNAWWSRYVGAVVQLMQKAPQTTAVIITNDGSDRVGFQAGPRHAPEHGVRRRPRSSRVHRPRVSVLNDPGTGHHRLD